MDASRRREKAAAGVRKQSEAITTASEGRGSIREAVTIIKPVTKAVNKVDAKVTEAAAAIIEKAASAVDPKKGLENIADLGRETQSSDQDAEKTPGE